jgi:acetyl esterase
MADTKLSPRELRYIQLRARGITRILEGVARLTYHPRRTPLCARRLLRDIAYGPLAEQKLDLYLPESPRALVVYVHGGGFTMLSKQTHQLMAERYAKMGYAVAVIDYRLAPMQRFPSQLDDASLAIDYLVDNAHQWQLPVSRMLLAGESAGGNLVLALALASCLGGEEPFAQRMRSHHGRISGLVATYGYLDLSAGVAYAHERRAARPGKPPLSRSVFGQLTRVARAYVHGDPAQLTMAERYASPLVLLEAQAQLPLALPPTFVDCGTRDPLLRQSRRLAAKLAELGTRHELHVVVGELHGYDAFTWRPASREKWRRVEAFLRATEAA